jgi:hypothetical protein
MARELTEPEKAALEWALTHVAVTHAPDTAYEPLARYYDDKQVANITHAIALMNAWNRVAIGFHRGPEPHPLADPAHPEWADLNSTVGAQYLWADRIFAYWADERNFLYQLVHSSPSPPKPRSRTKANGLSRHGDSDALFAAEVHSYLRGKCVLSLILARRGIMRRGSGSSAKRTMPAS